VHNITFFEAADRENSLIAEGKSVVGARKNPFLAATTPYELVPLLPVSPAAGAVWIAHAKFGDHAQERPFDSGGVVCAGASQSSQICAPVHAK
jgi:hypothetical protein